MKKKLTPTEVEKRFAEINALSPESPTKKDIAAIHRIEYDDLSSAVSLEDFKKSLDEYSGKLVLRIPKSLHKSLKEAAEIEGVSLNQYMLYKLSR